MPALHVRNVDDAVIDALKERARRNNRSLEGELREILTRAAFSPVSGKGVSKIRIKTVSVASDSMYGREDLYADEGR